ncbi:hypothetical protein [Streptomyces sp. NPDC089799]|uniref:hypothetical protein n=1 Tax=Streptomyces sp. NPDC089799 TaxID=3155066 RepID=UPI003431C42D
MRRARAAGTVAVVLAAAVALTGCEDLSGDPKPGPSASSKGTVKPGPKPGPKTTPPKSPKTSKSPGPVTSPPPDDPSPGGWGQKGPATLTGCGTFKSGFQCTFQGADFKPGERIHLRREGQTTEHVFTADSRGGFVISPVHNPKPGSYTYTASGEESGLRATTQVEVTAGTFG